MSTSPRAGRPMVVLTVDDHPLIRAALRDVLRRLTRRIELLEASNPEEGLAALRRRPDLDLVLLDLVFADHDGLRFLTRFRKVAPAVPLVVYTMHEDSQTLRQALAAGAVGVIPKTHSAKLMRKAIELVIDGGIYLPPKLARELAGPARLPPATAMSERQLRVLELLAQGLPNKELARTLGIASATVKGHVTAVLERLGVSNRTQAAIAARAFLKKSDPD